jgi:hypothetical protein
MWYIDGYMLLKQAFAMHHNYLCNKPYLLLQTNSIIRNRKNVMDSILNHFEMNKFCYYISKSDIFKRIISTLGPYLVITSQKSDKLQLKSQWKDEEEG